MPDGEVRFGFPNISDNAEIVELIACGSHLILFTTGRGSVFGCKPVPSIKLATNTPMYEIWTYAVSPAEDKVYYAVWGGGVLEYDQKTERWKDYNDPDGETELVLMKDQGLIQRKAPDLEIEGARECAIDIPGPETDFLADLAKQEQRACGRAVPGAPASEEQSHRQLAGARGAGRL